MKNVTRNEVDSSEIFHYAKKKHGVGWNDANDMFFGNSLEYKSYDDFYIGKFAEYTGIEFKDANYDELDECDKGRYILEEFMIENNITEMRVDNT